MSDVAIVIEKVAKLEASNPSSSNAAPQVVYQKDEDLEDKLNELQM